MSADTIFLQQTRVKYTAEWHLSVLWDNVYRSRWWVWSIVLSYKRTRCFVKRNSPFSVFGLQQAQVTFPFVGYDFTAREASYWDDHCRAVRFAVRSCEKHSPKAYKKNNDNNINYDSHTRDNIMNSNDNNELFRRWKLITAVLIRRTWNARRRRRGRVRTNRSRVILVPDCDRGNHVVRNVSGSICPRGGPTRWIWSTWINVTISGANFFLGIIFWNSSFFF